MKIIIEADSQEEFDSKREELIKAIASNKIKLSTKVNLDQHKRKMDDKAMRESYNEWKNDFSKMIGNIKKDVRKYLETVA